MFCHWGRYKWRNPLKQSFSTTLFFFFVVSIGNQCLFKDAYIIKKNNYFYIMNILTQILASWLFSFLSNFSDLLVCFSFILPVYCLGGLGEGTVPNDLISFTPFCYIRLTNSRLTTVRWQLSLPGEGSVFFLFPWFVLKMIVEWFHVIFSTVKLSSHHL